MGGFQKFKIATECIAGVKVDCFLQEVVSKSNCLNETIFWPPIITHQLKGDIAMIRLRILFVALAVCLASLSITQFASAEGHDRRHNTDETDRRR